MPYQLDPAAALRLGQAVLQQEAEALHMLADRIGDDFVEAVRILLDCRGRLVVSGVGKSGHIGRKLAATFASTGTPAFFVHAAEAAHGDLGMITSDDVVLAISYSGETNELLTIVPTLKREGARLIAMTGNPNSSLAKYADVHLNCHVEREACPLNLAPTSSTTAALAMGDALACALMEVRHFRAQDFARFHPGGSLGRRLLTRARDVMRSDDLPMVAWDMKLGDAIIPMSEGKLGLLVAMEGDTIRGIITDGDLRRIMQRWHARFFDLQVKDVMTPNPKRIHPDMKIAEAEQLLNRYKIHSLLVVDEDDHLVGIVDNFSCML